MAFDPAESSRYSLWRGTAAETAWAETPSTPALTQIPITGGFPEHVKSTVRTNVLDGLGMMGQLIQTAQEARLTAPFELTIQDFQWAFEGVLRNTYSAISIVSATDISASTTDDSFNSTTTNFVTANIKTGTWFKVAGFVDAANNGIFRAATVTTTKVIVNAKITTAGVITLTPNLVTEIAPADVDITGKFARNANIEKSYLLEARVTDIATAHYETYRGMRPAQLDITVTAGAIITGSLQMVGERGRLGTATVGSGDTVWSSAPSIVAGTNIGTILEGGAILAANLPQEIAFSLNANARVDRAVTAITPVGIGYGRWGASGSMRTYFESVAMRTKFVNHTATSLVIPFADIAGNVLIVSFPSLQFATNPMTPTDPDSPLSAPYTWEAQPTGAATTDYMAEIDILVA